LSEIEADHIPILTVVNKIDRLAEPNKALMALQDFPNSVAISALTGLGINELLKAVNDQLFEKFVSIAVCLPYQQGNLISQFHELGQVDQSEHVRGGVEIHGKLPGRLVARYRPYMIGPNREREHHISTQESADDLEYE
jgi:GTP-binding protein HflX